MSGQLRTLKNRIRSVEGTKKITRAMEMVAAAKLHRFQDMMVKARPFTEGLENLLGRLFEANPDLPHPFFSAGGGSALGGEPREEKRAALVLITSDTGLCGSFNNDLVELARRFLAPSPSPLPSGERVGVRGKPILIGVGKIGIAALKRMGESCAQTFTDMRASRVEEVLGNLISSLEKIYLEKMVDAIYVVYSHFLTVSTYQPVVEKLLPLTLTLSPQAGRGEKSIPLSLEGRGQGEGVPYIFEPSAEAIFAKLIPLYFESRTRMIFLESFVSEQVARMRAMHQATENAKEMIDSLVLLRNKVRQAAITKEIIEIVSGSRALKIK